MNRHFLFHYAQMVAVMFVGMGVLWLPAEGLLGLLGSSWSALDADAPAAKLGLMTLTMTVPMIGWMRWRGHSDRANAEMAAAMVVPTLAVIALLAVDVVTDASDLIMLEHVAMFAAMFAVMLARPAEYAHRH